MATLYRLCVATALVLGVSACSSTPSCLQTQPYQQAKSYPSLDLPPGLAGVDSDNQMMIPGAKQGPIGTFAEAPANTAPDNPAARCLTTPPPLPQSQIDMSRQAES